MLNSDPANATCTAKIPLTRLVERTFKGQRNQIEPAPSKIDISKPFREHFKTIQQISSLRHVEGKRP